MADRVGQQLGNYGLLRLLGEGGFAEVYLGQHVHIRTMYAAIKVLHAQLGQDYQEGFLQEAETIALLKHPNIIRILDFGIENAEKTPYFIMDYAPHGTLRTCHPKGSIVPLATVLAYVQQISQALQYAHEHQRIHRDLKPENLLVGENHEILLSDFGIAALAHSTRSLEPSTYAGTVPYSAPEQIQGKPRRESDQYSLGIILYEWLTGNHPFTGTLLEIFSQHLAVAPPPLHEKVPNIPSAVETVVMRTLAKDPHQRFASMHHFAEAFEQACISTLSARVSVTSQDIPDKKMPSDLSSRKTDESRQTPHHIPNEKVRRPGEVDYKKTDKASSKHAPPRTSQSLWYRINNFFGKIRILAWLSFIAVILTASFLIGSSIIKAGDASGFFLYGVGIGVAAVGLIFLLAKGRVLVDILGGVAFIVLGFLSMLVLLSDVVYQERSFLFPLLLLHIPLLLIGTRFFLRKANTAGGLVMGSLLIITGTLAAIPEYHLEYYFVYLDWFTFLPLLLPSVTLGIATIIVTFIKRRSVAISQPPQGTISHQPSNQFDISNLSTAKELLLPTAGRGFSRRQVLAGLAALGVTAVGGGGIIWWVFSPRPLYIYRGHTGWVNAVAWSPDGKRIASVSDDRTVQVWNATDGSHVFTYRGHTSEVLGVSWSPDGKRIVSTSYDDVQVWNATDGRNVYTHIGSTYWSGPIAWSPDGKRIASLSEDGIQMLNAADGSYLYTLNSGYTLNLIWSPDGKRIASLASPGIVVWNAADGSHLYTLNDGESMAWSPDGMRIAFSSSDFTIQVRNATNSSHIYTYRGHTSYVLAMIWLPDGKRIASASEDGTVQVWNATDGRNVFTYKWQPSPYNVNAVAWSPHGMRIASGGYDVEVWQIE